jgi:4-amino-4-deoxy-L-arabinose transferase-like glycosyltransferase
MNLASKRNIQLVLFLCIFALGGFLRFYQLTTIPNGLNQDESAIGYDAYSILTTGRDEHNQAWPLYFKSFGDQKLPVYIYLTAASEYVFGLNEFAVRFSSALLGTLAVLMCFFIVKELSGKINLSLLSMFLLAINPWHLFFSRAAFEDNVALAFSMCGVWLFLLAMRSKPWLYLPLSMVGFAFSLYSYNVTRLLAPLLLMSLVIYKWKKVQDISWKIKVGVILFLVVLLLPFLYTFFSPSGVSSAHGALITRTDIQAKGIEMRSYFINESDIIGKIFFNKYVFLVWQYIENIGRLFSANFFFISGSEHGTQGIGNVGNFYLFQFPLIIAGVIFIFRKKTKDLRFFVIWAVLAGLVASLSKDVPHATRDYFLVIPLTVFSAMGVLVTYNYMQKIQKRSLRIILVTFCLGLIAYNLIYYFSSYYLRFPRVYAEEWKQQDKALTDYLLANEHKYNKILFDDSTGYMYTSFLFYSGYSPEKFHKIGVWNPDDIEGYSTVHSIGKYEWRSIIDKDRFTPHNLIITSLTSKPYGMKVLKTFSYPSKPLVISTKEQLSFYPKADVAYVLLESKPKPKPKMTDY